MYLLRIADIASGSSFEPRNSMEQKLGYVVESELSQEEIFDPQKS